MAQKSDRRSRPETTPLPVFISGGYHTVTFTPSLRGFPEAVRASYQLLRQCSRWRFHPELTEAMFNYCATALLWARTGAFCDEICYDGQEYRYAVEFLRRDEAYCMVPEPLADFINSIGPFEAGGLKFQPTFPAASTPIGKLRGTLGTVKAGDTAEVYQDIPVLGVAIARCWAEMQLKPNTGDPIPNLQEFVPEGENWETTLGLLGNGPIAVSRSALETYERLLAFDRQESFDRFGFSRQTVSPVLDKINMLHTDLDAVKIPLKAINFDGQSAGSFGQLVATWQSDGDEQPVPEPSSSSSSTAWPRQAAFRRPLSKKLWSEAVRYCFNDFLAVDSEGVNHGWCCVRDKATGDTPPGFSELRNRRRNVPEDFTVRNVVTVPRTPKETWILTRRLTSGRFEPNPHIITSYAPTLRKTFTPSFRGFPELVSKAYREASLSALRSAARDDSDSDEDYSSWDWCSEALVTYYATVLLWARIVFIKTQTGSPVTQAEMKFLQATASRTRMRHGGQLPAPLARAINAIGPVVADGIEWIPEFPPMPNVKIGQLSGTFGVIEPNGTAEVYQDLPTIGVALARCVAEAKLETGGYEEAPNLAAFVPEGENWQTTKGLLGNGPIRRPRAGYANQYGHDLSHFGPPGDEFGYRFDIMSTTEEWFLKVSTGLERVDLEQTPGGSLSQLIPTCYPMTYNERRDLEVVAHFREKVDDKLFYEALCGRYNDFLLPDELGQHKWCCVRSSAAGNPGEDGGSNSGPSSIPPGFHAARNRRRNVPEDFNVRRFDAELS